MAEIHITAMHHDIGGPSLPTRHSASIGHKEWPGGGTVPTLHLRIGPEQLIVWPADADDIEELGKRLIALADELREKP